MSGVVQLHTTQHCNLQCSHCYSSSGPHAKGGLDGKVLPQLLADAAREGYEVLSISGGEPLMDPGLYHQIDLARDAGLRVNLVTNGTLLQAEQAAALATRVNTVAVSLDGPPDLHNRLRASPSAFARALRGIGHLRDAGVTFAIIHTARIETLGHLRWLAGLAQDLGAAALHLHPLEAIGRAAELHRAEFDAADLATRLALLTGGLRRDFDGLAIQVDVLPLGALPRPAGGDIAAMPLGDLIDPLVVEPDGTLSPWTFGMDRRFSLGTLSRQTLADAAARYRRDGLARTLRHAERIRAQLQADHPWPYVNWFEHLATAGAPAL